MNANEKAEILKQNGFFYTTSNFNTTKHRWYRNEDAALNGDLPVAAGATFAMAANAAYAEYLKSQNEDKKQAVESPTDEEQRAANLAKRAALLKTLPAVKAGDMVKMLLNDWTLGKEAPIIAASNAGGWLVDIEGYKYHCFREDFELLEAPNAYAISETQAKQARAELDAIVEPPATDSTDRPVSELLADIRDNKISAKDAIDYVESFPSDAITLLLERNAEIEALLSKAQADFAAAQEIVSKVEVSLKSGIEASERFNDAYYVGKSDGLRAILRHLQSSTPTPQVETVTLSEEAIRFLAERKQSHGMIFAFKRKEDISSEILTKTIVVWNERHEINERFLAEAYRTEANCAAIEAEYQSLQRVE